MDSLLSGIVHIRPRTGKTAGGTGFVLSYDGYILTCSHVIQTKERQARQEPVEVTVAVRFKATDEERTATVVYLCPYKKGDIALLRLDGSLPLEVHPLHLGSSKMTKGHPVFTYGYGHNREGGLHASGYSYGLGPIDEHSGQELLQIQSQEITVGYSGAPIWDTIRHEIIGMVTQLAPKDEHGQFAGVFAISTERLVQELETVVSDITISSLSPYPGPRQLYQGEAPWFFGMNASITKIIQKLRKLQEIEQDPSCLVVLGPAGCGKSSLIQAGLFEHLDHNAVSGSKDWGKLCISLESDPYTKLAAHGMTQAEKSLVQSVYRWLQQNPTKKRLMLVFDHFERTLMQCPKEILDTLVPQMEECIHNSYVTIVIVMQNTYYSHLARYTSLATCVEKSLINLFPPSQADALTELTQRPAEVLGVTFDTGVLEACVEQVRYLITRAPVSDLAEPVSYLPLHATFLAQLWRHKKETHITSDSYMAIPSISEGTHSWAQHIYSTLTMTQQQSARDLLMHLVMPGDMQQGVPDSRRVQSLSSLCNMEQERELVTMLADEGLLHITEDEQTHEHVVMLAYDALLVEWLTLKDWIEEERHFQLWHQSLQNHMKLDDADVSKKKLLEAHEARDAALWLKHSEERLTEAERTYITTSIQQQAMEDQQREAQEKQEEQKKRAVAQRLAFQAKKLREQAHGLQSSAELALQAWYRFSSPETYQALHDSIALLPHLLSEVTPGSALHSVLISKNNTYLIVATSSGIVWRQGISGGDLFSANLSIRSTLLSIALFADGRYFVTAGSDDRICIWETRSGHLYTSWYVPTCHYVTVNRYGEIAVLGENGQLSLWVRGEDEKYICQWECSVSSTTRCQWSSNDEILVTAGEDGRVCLWDVLTGQLLTFIQADGPIGSFCVSPMGVRLAFSCKNGHVTSVWDWKDQQTQQTMEAKHVANLSHDDAVATMTFHPNEAYLATGSGKKLRLWRVDQNREMYRVYHEEMIKVVAFNEDGRYIVTGSHDATARLWECATGRELLRMPHSSAIQAVLCSPNDKYIVTASDDGTTRLWETLQGNEIARLYHTGGSQLIAFAPECSRSCYTLATVGGDGAIQIAHIMPHAFRSDRRFSDAGQVLAVAFSPAGDYLAAGSHDGTVYIWHVSTGKELHRFCYVGPVSALAFSSDGQYLASAGEALVVVHVITSGQSIATLSHTASISSITFCNDSHLLVTGSKDGIVRVWDLEASHVIPVQTMTHEAPVAIVKMSRNGQVVATASDDSSVRVWNWRDGEYVFHLLPHDRPVYEISFSDSGNLIATASEDGTAKIWEVGTGELLTLLPLERSRGSIALSPDGKYIVSAGQHEGAGFWQLETNKPIFQGVHEADIARITFSPDGKYLVTISQSGVVCIWVWQPEDLCKQARIRLQNFLSEEEWEKYSGGNEPYLHRDPLTSWRAVMHKNG